MLRKCLVIGCMVFFLSACVKSEEHSKEENESRNDTSYREKQESKPAQNF